MESFLGFIRKEFYHIFRDKRTMAILFGMPIIQLLLFGYAIRNEIEEVKLAILDQSKDAVTKAITDKLIGTGYFKPILYLHTADEIDKAFRQGQIDEALVFEPGFGNLLQKENKASVQIITDGSNPNVSRIVTGYTASVLKSVQQQYSQTLNHTILIEPDFTMLFNPELKSVYLFVPGLMALILLLVSALMTSITITREKEFGTMEILLVSPLQPYQIILGKVLPYLALSFINVITVLITARLVFGVPCQGSIALLFFECFLYTLTALSLGILISTVAGSQQVAMMISLAGLLLPTVLLSGFIFPVTSMPMPLQVISNIIPAKWFLIIVRSLMLKGVGLEIFWKETLILFGMSVVLMTVSMKKFKIRLD